MAQNRGAWFALGRQLERDRKQLKRARDVYATYVDVATTPAAKANGWYRIGMLERKLRRYESSKFAFQTAGTLDPKMTKAAERLAQVSQEQDDAKSTRERQRSRRRSRADAPTAGSQTKAEARKQR